MNNARLRVTLDNRSERFCDFLSQQRRGMAALAAEQFWLTRTVVNLTGNTSTTRELLLSYQVLLGVGSNNDCCVNSVGATIHVEILS